jgi:hypothetical protein
MKIKKLFLGSLVITSLMGATACRSFVVEEGFIPDGSRFHHYPPEYVAYYPEVIVTRGGHHRIHHPHYREHGIREHARRIKKKEDISHRIHHKKNDADERLHHEPRHEGHPIVQVTDKDRLHH